MSEAINFLAGVLALGFCIAALFFFRFFAHTRDRLFLMFGISFALMAVNRILLTASVIPDESLTGLYVIRLISFVIILGAVLDKNLAPKRARRRAVRAAAQQRQAESHG